VIIPEKNEIDILTAGQANNGKPGQKGKIELDLAKFSDYKLMDYQGDRLALELAFQAMDRMDKAARKHFCGTFLEFHDDVFFRGNFCHLRLCPMCAWRLARKTFSHLSKILEYMDNERPYRYLHLVLTCKNCFGPELSETLDLLLAAFHRLTMTKPFLRSILGYFRKIEISHNWHKNDYHPHLHVLLAVSPLYFDFRDTNILFLAYEWWREAWRMALGVDYEPQIWLRAIKKSYLTDVKGMESVQDISPVLEISKYVSKATDYIAPSSMQHSQNRTNEAVWHLDGALAGRRLVAYGGDMKRVHRLINKQEKEKSDDPLCEVVQELIRYYGWKFNIKHYKEIKPDIKVKPSIILQ
jgi:plasmid rolling circle replication initiator protein Rep